ncbi:hypothetical protein AGMMS49944_30920 [Spirochaetia bacterium]|nr:hypothetical protein AGMMS49944_30920 [Spirochaetia bacterium]
MLAARSGFNATVRYVKTTVRIDEALDRGKNPADILCENEYRDLDGLPLLRLLLLDKRGYRAVSANPTAIAADLPALAAEFAQWKAVDLAAACHDPGGGLLLANPKRAESLAALGNIRPRELLVVYAGKASEELCLEAAKTAVALFSGAKADIAPELYLETPEAFPMAAHNETDVPLETMTPRYSVTVTNELFHNSNVEAWKRIVSAYTSKYPGLRVHIFYEGDPILDINSLFTWGKVKHGGTIQFAVSGRDIRDVSRLRRYLAQGAGPNFSPLLQTPANGGLF